MTKILQFIDQILIDKDDINEAYDLLSNGDLIGGRHLYSSLFAVRSHDEINVNGKDYQIISFSVSEPHCGLMIKLMPQDDFDAFGNDFRGTLYSNFHAPEAIHNYFYSSGCREEHFIRKVDSEYQCQLRSAV